MIIGFYYFYFSAGLSIGETYTVPISNQILYTSKIFILTPTQKGNPLTLF